MNYLKISCSFLVFLVFVLIAGFISEGGFIFRVQAAVPSSPVYLYTNNAVNPIDVTTSSPTLSAEYDNSDTSDTASFYEIQVIADGGNWASPYWDSAKSA